MLKVLSPAERITRERIQLLLKYPFFGYLALGLEVVETDQIPTMGTNGKYLFYNASFVESLSPENLKAVIAHEALHCALGHLWRQGGRQKDKWNHAADFAINLIVQKEGLELPPGNWCIDRKYIGMAAEKIYELLPDPKQIPGNLLDSHDKWPGSSSAGPPPNENLPDNSDGNQDDKEKNIGTEQKPNPEDLKNQWQERLVRAAHQAKMRGNLPGVAAGMIADILEPKLDWRTILREMIMSTVKNDFRFIPPAKKYLWQGIYLPSLFGERLEIAIGLDTSSSVNQEEFQKFLAEVRGITDQFEDYLIHLFLCDTAIHDYMAVTPQSPWPKSFRKKDGGTSFIPVFEKIEKDSLEISCLVYLTDGEGSFPGHEPEYPVIWTLNKDSRVPWGTTIKIELNEKNSN